MIWLTWRQFRGQALAGLAVLAAAALYLLISGLQMHHSYTADLAACTPQNACGVVLGHFKQGYGSAFHLVQLLVIAAPGLIGIFWGAPLIAQEFERGTHQLAWNQTVTRTRWLASKLACVGAASIATTGLLSYLLTWWATPLDHITGSRFAALTFATRDVVPLGYAAFAFALATTTGLLLRRTIPAMVLTLAVFVGVQIVVPTVVRPFLMTSTTVTFPVNQATASRARSIYTTGGGAQIHIDGLPVPQGAWVVSAPPIENASDHVVPAYRYSNCLFPGSGPQVKAGGADVNRIAACLTRYQLHESVTYQPASHYWPLQWYETGIFLALAAALSGSCFWWIRRRQN